MHFCFCQHIEVAYISQCTHSSDLAFDEDDILDENQDLFTSRQRETESKEKQQEEEEETPVVTQPQPAFITTRINDKEVVRTNDIRVSERTPLTELRLKPFSPIYNELTGEVIIFYISHNN